MLLPPLCADTVTFSCTRADRLSPALAAEAFDTPTTEVERDFATLLDGGAIPLTLSEGDTLLCQGLALPMLVEDCPLWYLYALVTPPIARGHGHLRTLLRECAATAQQKKVHGLCLLPANQSLAEAYRRMGFDLAYPVGAPAIATKEDGLALRTLSVPTRCEPITARELYGALPQALSPLLFEYALTTVADLARPVLIDGTPALSGIDDPCTLLAIADDRMAARVSSPELLLMPLGGRLPRLIPEPIPR